MEYMIRYMFVPGRVENNNLIVDLKNLGVADVPIQALKDVYSVMSKHYIGRVYKFYVCNMSWFLKGLASVCQGMLTDRQRHKLVFIKELVELREDFAAHQLE